MIDAEYLKHLERLWQDAAKPEHKRWFREMGEIYCQFYGQALSIQPDNSWQAFEGASL